jgi:TolB-like protein/class 3 adenylate cyclase/Tfp pilus assembly protein PilF
MAIEQFRLLAAIMFADIVGYTAMMQEDEAKAKRIRDRQREVLEACIDKYHGKIIQYYGDGTLSIFGSALEAVRCAIRIQRRLTKQYNIPLRIGLHLGDIVYDDEGAYGDAVNVAARIEALSTGGGILISDRINDELKSHPEIKTQLLGEYRLKNVSRPMELYCVVEKNLAIPTSSEIQLKTGSIRRSIAVLPFVNMSADPENEYFSDGITEEIINALTNVEGLEVASRTSVFAYKGINKNIRHIGKELQVGYLLEGSVRKWGDRVRITAQLINMENGFHLWSETYDRESKDIFEIQDEIARKIASKLQKGFSPEDQKLVVPKAENIECYNEYLKAKYYWHKWTPEDALKSIDHYERAVAISPNFAEAYAGIAYSYSFLGATGRLSPKVAFPKAEEAAKKSLAIKDQLPDSQLALAVVRLFHYWDLQGAKKYLQRALAMRPDSPKIKYVQALYLKVKGKHKAAVRVLSEALQKNPLSLYINTDLARAYLNLGKPAEALEQYNRTLELDPNFRSAIEGKGWAFVAFGDYDSALQIFESYHESIGHKLRGITPLGYLHGKMGNREKAQYYLELLRQRDEEDPEVILYMDYALINLGMGDYDQVFHYLQQAVKERLGNVLFINSNPVWDELKSDNRFYDLLQQIGLAEATGTTKDSK